MLRFPIALQDPTAILSNPIMPSCQLPDVAFRGSMVYWYNSTSFRDDLAWAAAWMYKATRDPDYLGDAYGFWDTHKMLEGDYDIRYLVRLPAAVARSLCLQESTGAREGPDPLSDLAPSLLCLPSMLTQVRCSHRGPSPTPVIFLPVT